MVARREEKERKGQWKGRVEGGTKGDRKGRTKSMLSYSSNDVYSSEKCIGSPGIVSARSVCVCV